MNCPSDRCDRRDGLSKPEISSSVIATPRKVGGSKGQVETGLQMQHMLNIHDQSETVVIPYLLKPAIMDQQSPK